MLVCIFFVCELFPPDITAITIAVILMISGVITPEEGIAAVIKLISNKRYSQYGTTESMGDPNKYFTAVKAGGYATSPGYVAKNMSLYNKNILPLLEKYFPK